MAVYVDRLRDWGWRLGPSCHLVADNSAELHAFAARLGMRRSWAQVSRSGVAHYDLTAARRTRAVLLGAVDCAGTPTRFLAASRAARKRGR